jgi:FkbM family methyltransferase
MEKLKKMILYLIFRMHLHPILSYIRENNRSLIQKRKNFYAQFLKRDCLYFDVGANYGNRILPIISILDGGKIVAIEPQAKCVKYLRKKWGNKISIVPKGLGAKEETKIMYISNLSQLSSFSSGWVSSVKKSGAFDLVNAKWNKEEEIEITTLDRLIDEFGVPNFIKIDVEGYELEVLTGLTRPIEMISFEYTIPERTEQAVECIKQVKNISDSNIACNYSVGENMEWALKDWISPEEMILEINSTSFPKGFGDIYVKYIK